MHDGAVGGDGIGRSAQAPEWGSGRHATVRVDSKRAGLQYSIYPRGAAAGPCAGQSHIDSRIYRL